MRTLNLLVLSALVLTACGPAGPNYGSNLAQTGAAISPAVNTSLPAQFQAMLGSYSGTVSLSSGGAPVVRTYQFVLSTEAVSGTTYIRMNFNSTGTGGQPVSFSTLLGLMNQAQNGNKTYVAMASAPNSAVAGFTGTAPFSVELGLTIVKAANGSYSISTTDPMTSIFLKDCTFASTSVCSALLNTVSFNHDMIKQ